MTTPRTLRSNVAKKRDHAQAGLGQENFDRDPRTTREARQPPATLRSRPKPTPKRRHTGGAEAKAGTGSPRKIFAFARWIAQAITAYQRRISSEGSSPKAAARAAASVLVMPTVSFAHLPCLSKERARKSKGTARRPCPSYTGCLRFFRRAFISAT